MKNVFMKYPNIDGNRLADGKLHKIIPRKLYEFEYQNEKMYYLEYIDSSYFTMASTILTKGEKNVFYKRPLSDYSNLKKFISSQSLKKIDISVLGVKIDLGTKIDVDRKGNLISKKIQEPIMASEFLVYTNENKTFLAIEKNIYDKFLRSKNPNPKMYSEKPYKELVYVDEKDIETIESLSNYSYKPKYYIAPKFAVDTTPPKKAPEKIGSFNLMPEKEKTYRYYDVYYVHSKLTDEYCYIDAEVVRNFLNSHIPEDYNYIYIDEKEYMYLPKKFIKMISNVTNNRYRDNSRILDFGIGMNISDVISNFSNPLSSIDSVKALLEAYKNFNFSSEVLAINAKDKKQHETDKLVEDKYYTNVYNIWRNNILKFDSDMISKLIIQKKLSQPFIIMKDALSKDKGLKSKNSILYSLGEKSNSRLTDTYQKYTPFKYDGYNWHVMSSKSLDFSKENSIDYKHQLTLNVDSDYVHFIADYIVNYCNKRNISFKFKYNHSDNIANSFIIYCSDDNIAVFFGMLKELFITNPNLIEHIHKPSILSGNYYDCIGYTNIGNNMPTDTEKIKSMQSVFDLDFNSWGHDFLQKRFKVINTTYNAVDYLSLYILRIIMSNYNVNKDRTSNEKLYLQVKKYICENINSIFVNDGSYIPALSIQTIDGTTQMSFYEVAEIIKELYINDIKNDNNKLEILRHKLIKAVNGNNISESIYLSQDTQEELNQFRQFEGETARLTSAKRANNIDLYPIILRKIDEIAVLLKDGLYIENNEDLDSILSLEFAKLKSITGKLSKVSVHKYSSSSLDDDERNQFYIRAMIVCLKEKDFAAYQEYRSLYDLYSKEEKSMSIL